MNNEKKPRRLKVGWPSFFQYAKLEPSVSPRSEVPTYQDSPRRIALTLVSKKPYRSVNCPHSLVYASFSLDCRAAERRHMQAPYYSGRCSTELTQTKDLNSSAESLHMHNLLLMLTMTTAPEKLGPWSATYGWTLCCECESLRLCSYSTCCL